MSARIKYFHISSGLRGAYLADGSFVLKVRTYRDLKSTIAHEASHWREAGYAGLSKKAIGAFCQTLWREATKTNPATLPYCLAMKPEHAKEYSWGIFGSVATREDYVEYEMEND